MGLFSQTRIVSAQALEPALAQLLEVEQDVSRLLRDPDQLVELDLRRRLIAVLSVLNNEHEEGDDRRAGVDHKVPGIPLVEQWADERPLYDDRGGEEEAPRASSEIRRELGKAGKPACLGDMVVPISKNASAKA